MLTGRGGRRARSRERSEHRRPDSQLEAGHPSRVTPGVQVVDQHLAAGADAEVGHERPHHAPDTAEVLRAPSPGRREQYTRLSCRRGTVHPEHLPRTESLSAVDDRLESRRYGVRVDRRADDEQGHSADGGGETGHVVVEGAVPGVVALVAPDARADLEVVDEDDLYRPASGRGRLHGPSGEDGTEPVGPGAALQDQDTAGRCRDTGRGRPFRSHQSVRGGEDRLLPVCGRLAGGPLCIDGEQWRVLVGVGREEDDRPAGSLEEEQVPHHAREDRREVVPV